MERATREEGREREGRREIDWNVSQTSHDVEIRLERRIEREREREIVVKLNDERKNLHRPGFYQVENSTIRSGQARPLGFPLAVETNFIVSSADEVSRLE